MDLHFLSGLEESTLKNKNTFNNNICLTILHRKGDEKLGKSNVVYCRRLLLSSAQQCLFALTILCLQLGVFEFPTCIYQTSFLFMCQ